MMLTVPLSIRGASFIHWLALGGILTAAISCPFSKTDRPFRRRPRYRSVGTENYCESCQFRDVSLPFHAFDISPCSFFLFSELKMKLKSQEFQKLEELRPGVEELLGQIIPLDRETESKGKHQ
jgi:hypothetical protein